MDDLISRQAALRAVSWDTEAYTAINNLPSAQPEQKWIPVTERLPEEDVEVLISYRYKEGEGDERYKGKWIPSEGSAPIKEALPIVTKKGGGAA